MARGFQPGNEYGTGQNQFSPRRRGSVVSVSVESAQMGAMARRVAGMSARADKPIMAAYHDIAYELQDAIATSLTNSVSGRKRVQRKKPAPNRLASAIRSPRNRRVNVDGFTVGYLDEIAAVRPYWRGLEVGSSRHVGRFLRGSFQNAAGKLVAPQKEGGRDPRFLQFRATTFATFAEAVQATQAAGGDGRGRGLERRVGVQAGSRALGVRIKNPIVGYHYFREGTRSWVRAGWTGAEALERFQSHLTHAGLGELASILTSPGFKRSSRGFSGRPASPKPNPRAYPDDPTFG